MYIYVLFCFLGGGGDTQNTNPSLAMLCVRMYTLWTTHDNKGLVGGGGCHGDQ